MQYRPSVLRELTSMSIEKAKENDEVCWRKYYYDDTHFLWGRLDYDLIPRR